MATAIKETPVLEGEAARRFLKTIRENEQKKVPKADYQRAKEAYRNFKVVYSINQAGKTTWEEA